MTDQIAGRYLARVRRALPRGEQRARQMAQATALVERYLQENPGAQAEELNDAFGAPREFAATVAGEQAVEQARRQRKRLCFTSVGAAFVVLAVVAAVFFVQWRELRQILPEDDFAVIKPVKTLTPEEFEALWNDENLTRDGD